MVLLSPLHEEKENLMLMMLLIEKLLNLVFVLRAIGLHIKNDFEYYSIDFGNGKKCFRLSKENNNLKKKCSK